MTLDTFIKTWDSRYVDYDGNRKFWCVDLVRRYIKDVYGIDPYVAIPPVVNAKDIWTKFNPKYFTKEVNGKLNFPAPGDIVIWGFYPGVTGWSGHVAVNITGAPMNLISFDQNYPTGTPCHRQLHNYKGVYGWLKKI